MGRDSIVTAMLNDDEQERLCKATAERKMKRDALSVDKSRVVVLLGLKIYRDIPSGQRDMKLIDLGIAAGSAAKTAMMHNADNRIMLSAGGVSKELGFINDDSVLSIPSAASGKNDLFDRIGVYIRLDDGYMYEELDRYNKT